MLRAHVSNMRGKGVSDTATPLLNASLLSTKGDPWDTERYEGGTSIPWFIVLHRCCIFLQIEGKTHQGTRLELASLQRSGTKPAMSLGHACTATQELSFQIWILYH